MKTIDEVFPIMHRREPPRPFPGLTIVGGLAAWGFEVVYHRSPHEIMVRATMSVPARDTGQLIRVRNERIFSVLEFGDADAEYAMRVIMEWIRGFAMHEVLEGLAVGGRPYYEREVESGHGSGR